MSLCIYKNCYYFSGCDRLSRERNPVLVYQLIAPDCFGCKLISEQISCPPDWRILKRNGDYCIQRKDRFWIFSKWTYIRRESPWGEAIRWFRTAYEAYVEIEELIKEIEKQKIRLAEEAKKKKEAKKVWKKENGVVCGGK